MKLSSILLMLGAGIIAIVAGWIYQSQNAPIESRSELEIPVDIDYYLSQVNYRVMAKTGKLDYQIKTPYLQHYKVEDISRIEQPEIDIYRNSQHWRVHAESGELVHQSNSLILSNDVLLHKQGSDNTRLEAQSLRFEPDLNLVVGEQSVRLQSETATIDADSVIIDIDQSVYRFTNSKSVYRNVNG